MFSIFFLLFISSSLGVPVLKENGEKRGVFGFERFEGDMMLSKQQIGAAEQGLDPTNLGGARGLKRSAQWPGGVVPYTIHSSAKNKFLNAIGIKGPTERVIYSAMKEWEEKTCIRFVPRTTQKDYVEFFAGEGCWSYVGNLKNGKQQISIGSLCYFHGIALHEIGHALGFWHEQSRPDRDDYVEIVWDNIKPENKLGFGCITHGIAVHEIGHALGMYHEQSRPDRDKYVTIYWDNIHKGSESNFYKYSHHVIDSLGIPYDYSSIMHYGKRELAWPPWKVTIEPKQSGVKIGQRRHLSTLDRKQMNMLYKCNKK